MKVEELMIGNKIIAKRIECVGDGGQFQEWDEFGEIIRILEDTVYVMFDKQKDDWEEIDIKDIQPIPLSAEILEKNGFTKKLDADRLHYWFILIDGHTKFSILYARSVFQWLGPLDFKYVHELQHALKLCGSQKEIVL